MLGISQSYISRLEKKDYKEAQEGDGKGLLIKMVIVRSHAWHLGNWLLTVT